jgi:hypothetical protein
MGDVRKTEAYRQYFFGLLELGFRYGEHQTLDDIDRDACEQAEAHLKQWPEVGPTPEAK